MPLEMTPYDPTDYLDSEERIAAYLEAAWVDCTDIENMEKRFAHLASCFEVVLLARQRWALSQVTH